ncbi:class II histone deacetylase [Novosphingobium sp.]|uniref:class II histone deacetylase n=1 Tax=Novosphingobium sp. TaxID=1874826 RepID=UPI0038BC2947
MSGPTLFLTDERTFWHSTGVQALFLPIGDWVEPPSGSYGADTPGSKRRLLNLVRAAGFDQHLEVRSAAPATREDLLRIHPASYIDEFKRLSDAGGGELGVFAPFSKGGFEIATLSAGLAIEAIDAVAIGRARNAYALCRPAGHHCLADQSMGFCLLANIPIAIEAAKARHGLTRVAVVDWDVHHGNGTQAIFYDRDDVLTISIHQDRCFPPGYTGLDDRGEGAGLGANLNVPLPAGSGHETYLAAIDRIVIPALERYKPDLIVVASGLDANAVDPLARQLLHSDSFRAMTSRMVEVADDLCGGRIAVIHEGGYAEAYVPFCGLAILESLKGERSPVVDPELDFFAAQQPDPRMVAFHFELIEEMRSSAGL